MKLSVESRQYYRLTVTTTPAVTAPWEASFDNGTTWTAGTDEGSGVWSWLLATGSTLDSANNPAGTITVATAAGQVTRPLLRCDNGSESIVADVPDDCVIEWV